MSSPPSLYDLPIPGLHLIEASAGTGKTWALTLLFLRALTDGTPVDRILVVTFTEAATADMKNRIHGLLVEARDYAVTGKSAERHRELVEKVILPAHSEILTRTLSEFDRAPIMTIHAFCRRLLREYAFEFETPFALDLEEDDTSLKNASAREIWRRRIYPENPEIARLTAALFPGGPEDIAKLFSFSDLAGCGAPAGPVSFAAARSRYLLLLEQCRTIGEADREKIVRACVVSQPSAGKGRRKKISPGDPGFWSEEEVRDRLRELCSGHPEPPPGFSEMDPTLLRVLSGMEGGSPRFALLTELLGQAEIRNRSLLESLKGDFLSYIAGELLEEKERRGVETYDDMIFRVLVGLEKDRTGTLAARIRERFPVAFIDEFQDTDQAQARIFDRIYRMTEVAEGREEHSSGLFLIGDPKQSIYRFRGADINAYLSVRKMVVSQGSRNLFSLSVNYRSDQSHVDAINHLFQISPDPFMTGGEIPWSPVDAHHSGPLRLLDPGQDGGEMRPPVLFYVSEGKETLDHFSGICAFEIRRLLSSPVRLDGQPVRPGDIAVLVRTHRHGKLIQEALGRIGVPSVAFDPDGVLKSPEALDLEILLLALSSPANRRKVRSALVSPFFGTPARDMLAYESSEEEWNRRVAPFFEAAMHWSWLGPMGSLRRFFLDEGLFSNLGKLPGGRRRITNILHLFEILESLGRDRCPLLLLVDRYIEARREAQRKKGESEGLRLESLEDRVKILTLHKSKGLEFPVVFLPFGISAREESSVNPGEAGNEDAAGGTSGGPEASEEMRLLYVALTRARHRTCLMIPVIRQKQRALARLLGIVTEKPGGQETNEIFRRRTQELVEGFPGLFGMLPAGEAEGGSSSRLSGEGEKRSFRARELSHPVPSPRTLESFTSLTRSLPGAGHEEEWEHPLRRDEGASAAEKEIVPDDLPAGPLFGTFFHRIMEILATREEAGADPPSAPELKKTGEQALRDAAVSLNPDCRDWPERVIPLVMKTLLTPFAPTPEGAEIFPEMTLSRIFRGIRAVEREFLMPVKDLAPAGLSGLLLDSGPRLSFDPASGYLRGFIDLIFCQGGRYYLLDYKTNRLASSSQASPYAPENLATAMAAHRYDLQGLIYCLALHRILSLQMERYEFPEHFGGVFFLFVRGLSVPGSPPGSGVFHDRPSLGKIRAFERLLRGELPSWSGGEV